MKARLLHPDRDSDWRTPLQAAAIREAARNRRQIRMQEFDRRAGLPWNDEALTADLGLATLFETMADGDDCVFEVSRRVVLGGVRGDPATIRHRQAILRDCLDRKAEVRELYAIAAEAADKQKRHYLGTVLARYPDSVLRYAAETMSDFLGSLRKLRLFADNHADRFTADGWKTLFETLRRELDDGFFSRAQHHLAQLGFRNGVLLTAGLGEGNKGGDYVLRRPPQRQDSWPEWWRDMADRMRGWLANRGDAAPRWLLPSHSPVYSFSLHPRDEAGARCLAELRNRGIALVAGALARSADHVKDFFGMLRAELAFYIGCLNLHETLAGKGEPVCLPEPEPAGERRLSCRGLYDVCLTLRLDERAVGNEVDADGRNLVVVTGANTGGKSTFLRSLGLAQLMMQCGMFVGAESFRASLCDGLFTHFKREEDAGMQSGKLDEELSRMSDIVDHLAPHALLLLNESFAATNEREGSEIARQIITALLAHRTRIVCVTHLFELARGFHERNSGETLFLRAERARTYRLREGAPLPTSFGEDLYQQIFAASADRTEHPPRWEAAAN
jgi:hypothetical protein